MAEEGLGFDEGEEADVDEAEDRDVDLGADDAWEDGEDCIFIEVGVDEDLGMTCDDGKSDGAAGLGVVEVVQLTDAMRDVVGYVEVHVKVLEDKRVGEASEVVDDEGKSGDEGADNDEPCDPPDPCDDEVAAL